MNHLQEKVESVYGLDFQPYTDTTTGRRSYLARIIPRYGLPHAISYGIDADILEHDDGTYTARVGRRHVYCGNDIIAAENAIATDWQVLGWEKRFCDSRKYLSR